MRDDRPAGTNNSLFIFHFIPNVTFKSGEVRSMQMKKTFLIKIALWHISQSACLTVAVLHTCMCSPSCHILLTFPVGWSCRIHWLHLCRGLRLPNECSRYYIKQSNREAPIIPEFWRMWSTPSLPLLPGPLWPGVVALDRVLPMGQIELFWLSKLSANKCHMLNWFVRNRTVWSFNCV